MQETLPSPCQITWCGISNHFIKAMNATTVKCADGIGWQRSVILTVHSWYLRTCRVLDVRCRPIALTPTAEFHESCDLNIGVNSAFDAIPGTWQVQHCVWSAVSIDFERKPGASNYVD